MSTRYTISLGFLIMALLLGSCEQEEPEAVIGEAVFFLEGELDGNPFLVEAGKNNYFMATNFAQDETGHYRLEGLLEQLNCAGGCLGDLGMTIFSPEAFPNNTIPPDAESFVQPGTYPLFAGMDQERTQYSAQFTAEPFGGNAVSYNWDFGDGTSSSEVNPSHTYPVDPTVSWYPVCLTITYDNNCSSELCSNVYLPNSTCKSDFEVTTDPETFLRYFAKPEGRPPFEYDWTFASGPTAQAADVDYDYHTNLGVDLVCLEVTDKDGCVSSVCKNVVVSAANADCATNFSYTTSAEVVEPAPDDTRSGKSEIVWIDAQGRQWVHVAENSSGIEILGAEPYETNDTGEQTMRLEVSIDAVLEYQGKQRRITATGFIAVAYPS